MRTFVWQIHQIFAKERSHFNRYISSFGGIFIFSSSCINKIEPFSPRAAGYGELLIFPIRQANGRMCSCSTGSCAWDGFDVNITRRKDQNWKFLIIDMWRSRCFLLKMCMQKSHELGYAKKLRRVRRFYFYPKICKILYWFFSWNTRKYIFHLIQFADLMSVFIFLSWTSSPLPSSTKHAKW